jgi:hypothetical protein
MIKNNITAIVLVLGGLLVVALAIIAYLFWRTRRIELECELLLRGTDGTNFVEIVNDNIDQVHALSGEVEALSERYAAVLRRIAGAVQHVGVVRFDAFRDLGGLLSFAVALLDDRGNGLVFSSIYGRSESRTYAKPCIERSSSYELSPEEREAIRLAMQSKDMGALPVEAKDKDHEERMANLRLFHDREYVTRTPEARAEAEAHITGEKPDVAERRPPRRPPEEQRQPAPSRPAARTSSPPRRKVGRANHIRPLDRAPEPERTPPPERGPEPELAPPTGRSLEDEVEKLLKPEAEPAGAREPGTPPGGIDTRGERGERTERQPRSERPIEKPAERVPQRKPTTPRPRGLDTPVDRLRNKEQE